MEKRALTLVAFTTVAAVGGAAYLWQRSRRDRKATPLHVKYHIPDVPTRIRVVAALPIWLRWRLIIKLPKPPTDGCDVFGESAYDPYEKVELLKGRLWRVRYKSMINVDLDGKFRLFGIDKRDATLLDRAPGYMRPRLEADMKRMEEAWILAEKKDKASILKAGFEQSQDMLVARLDDTGGLLLFNPCRMHPQIIDWIKDLGKVDWVVSGSGVHTNQVPEVAATYPSAKIVCSSVAELKCTAVGMRRADFVYTEATGPRSLLAANSALQHSGVKFHNIAGDTLQAMCALAHGHLFEVDLLYGNADGDRLALVDKTDWEESHDANLCNRRLFFYAGIKGVSCNGRLPNYRFLFMDPDNELCKMLNLEPKLDGSSCTEMAKSLRELLRLDFKAVNSAHSSRAGPMSADEFRRDINAAWRWLDGNSHL